MPRTMSDASETENFDLTLPAVTTKYTSAAEIVNKVIAEVREKVVDGADVYELCRMGDARVNEECAKLYNKKVEGEVPVKGVSFPCTVSRNEAVSYYSPMKDESVKIDGGDVVKIELGAHFDGFCAVAATTCVAGGAATGRVADAINAAQTAMEAVVRVMKGGALQSEATDMIQRVATEFGCVPVRGVYSKRLDRFEMDSDETKFANRSSDMDQLDTKRVFEENQAYLVEIAMSTGDGVARLDTEKRTTVFRRQLANNYVLKSAKAREFMGEVNRRYPVYAFSLADFEDATAARIGVAEARKHELFDEFPVLHERKAQTVAVAKATVILIPNGAKRIAHVACTGAGVGTVSGVKDEELAKLLATADPGKKKKKKTTKKDV